MTAERRARKKRAGVLLALDVGDVRIGVALSDEEQTVALAHDVIAARPRAAAVARILDLAAAEDVRAIIVGLPKTLAGGEGSQARKSRAFARALRRRTRIPVSFADERYTTRAADAAAAAKGIAVDAEAARLLLEARLSASLPKNITRG